MMLVGLRGVGKTVLLNKIRELAEAQGYGTVMVEATENRSLPELIIPGLRGILIQLDAMEGLSTKAKLAFAALRDPVAKAGAVFSEAALKEIVRQTEGYPYFLQEWGYQAWNLADKSSIDKGDIVRATTAAIKKLDESFFRVRFDRLTPREKDYLRALADLGSGPHRSGDVAARLGVKVETIAPLRSGLIRKGMVYSPAHGDTAFTVPLFDDFMRRTIPVWKKKA